MLKREWGTPDGAGGTADPTHLSVIACSATNSYTYYANNPYTYYV